MPVKLRDVARAAGVSTASASRALSAPLLVSPGLSARILAAAQRLGYVPNLAARTLATRRSGLVGVLAGSLADPLTTGLVEVLDRELLRAGYGIVLAFAGRNAAESAGRIRRLLAQGLDGLVALDEAAVSPEAAEALGAHGVSWLFLGEANGDESRDAMGRCAGAVLAARYLLSVGHQRIGVLAAERSAVAAALREALTGTAAILLGTKPPENRSHTDGLHDALAGLLDRSDPATAILCQNDSQAMAAVRECYALGVDVPMQVSIVGFGDTDLAKHSRPSLTTVRVAIDDIGTRTVEALLAMLRGEAAPVMEPAVKLVVRESTAVALA
ncbi:MAG TPA: LacI family DNA-binding transcriptional regulator [Casimicrobiaceae bacterium]|nr:LacI family DNA-binding transcriptional regulator [Casimicrobiaceae bacterium]